ncbi:hypothetical protein JCM5353_008406 [Sporobolomyces roseus]
MLRNDSNSTSQSELDRRVEKPPSFLTSLSLWSPSNPLLVGASTSLIITSAYFGWMRFGRRIRTVDDLRRSDFVPRKLRGVVTSVGDADNFRLWHRPILRRFATVPSSRADLKGETIHVRLAGVDAPELAHFGKPAQPFSSEALDLLTTTLLGKAVMVELHQKDRYSRVVGMAYVRSFPFYRRQNVSEVLLKAGLATVYRQAGAVHAGQLSRFEELEAKARAKKLGNHSMSSVSKSTREARARDFIGITGASSADATRYLKATSWRLEAALDTYYNDPRSSTPSQNTNVASAKNLETLWKNYCDSSNAEEIGLEGTMRYCEDINVNPEQAEMLALACFTKAPTMGRFTRKNWIEAWMNVQRDSVEQQREYVDSLRQKLTQPDSFREIYNYTFDFAKEEGQKSMPFEIAQELWNLLVPLDPASTFPKDRLGWWLDFLIENGSKVVSKDTWNLFLDFTRTIDPNFEQYDEEALNPRNKPGLNFELKLNENDQGQLVAYVEGPPSSNMVGNPFITCVERRIVDGAVNLIVYMQAAVDREKEERSAIPEEVVNIGAPGNVPSSEVTASHAKVADRTIEPKKYVKLSMDEQDDLQPALREFAQRPEPDLPSYLYAGYEDYPATPRKYSRKTTFRTRK